MQARRRLPEVVYRTPGETSLFPRHQHCLVHARFWGGWAGAPRGSERRAPMSRRAAVGRLPPRRRLVPHNCEVIHHRPSEAVPDNAVELVDIRRANPAPMTRQPSGLGGSRAIDPSWRRDLAGEDARVADRIADAFGSEPGAGGIAKDLATRLHFGIRLIGLTEPHRSWGARECAHGHALPGQSDRQVSHPSPRDADVNGLKQPGATDGRPDPGGSASTSGRSAWCPCRSAPRAG
jgi:hypothetical protein